MEVYARVRRAVQVDGMSIRRGSLIVRSALARTVSPTDPKIMLRKRGEQPVDPHKVVGERQ